MIIVGSTAKATMKGTIIPGYVQKFEVIMIFKFYLFLTM